MDPSVAVIQLTGVFDGTQSASFREEVRQAIDSGAQIILLDCQNLNFMDSSGLGSLIVALKMTRAENIPLCMCSINRQVGMLIDLTDTRRIFNIFADQQEFTEKVLQSPPS